MSITRTARTSDLSTATIRTWEQCEHTINSLYTLQLQLVKLAYLRGAEDREKMLR